MPGPSKPPASARGNLVLVSVGPGWGPGAPFPPSGGPGALGAGTSQGDAGSCGAGGQGSGVWPWLDQPVCEGHRDAGAAKNCPGEVTG